MSAFGRLWAASSLSSLGDGVTQAAGPLLAAALTRDPVLVAGLTVAEQLPWVLFALPSGVLVDRFDRRWLLTSASLVQVVALGLLAVVVALGQPGLPVLYAAFLLAGCAGVLYENASLTVLPLLVERARLEHANGRMLATRTVGQTLLGPPLAGVLFTLALWAPFALDTVAFVLVAALCLTLRVPRVDTGPRTTLRAAIAQGVRWLAGHRLLRTLTITVAVSNVALSAAISIMVLAVQERLGVGPMGYGLLLSCVAVGGILGALVTPRITALIGAATALRAGLIVEALTHLGLALIRDPFLGAVVLFVLGLQLLVFSTINSSLRQSLTPPELLGRVHSAYRLVTNSGMLLGAVLGGVLARYLGLTAPFWLGFVALSGVAVLVWRPLSTAGSPTGRR